jgi:glycosyltransferase involved in cell wall biosynthesis
VRLRIAQVSPLYESVPPALYGGTERVVSYLTEELVRAGHDVTLFASGDSRTSARLVEGAPRSLRLDAECRDPLPHHFRMLELVARESAEFDLIHFHVDYLHYPVSRRLATPNLTTLHGRLDIPDLFPLYDEFREVPLVSISDAQRLPVPRANWRATVHHGLPEDLLSLREEPGDYLAFLGRISPEKGVDRAISIALAAGMKLRIAAKVDAADREYFQTAIRPLLQNAGIEFVGEIREPDKNEFLGRAKALLFPIDWPEPFGLVMIEAMACGTPVIAWPRGSVPEVLEEGVSGFLVESEEEAVKALARLDGFDRRRCRRAFEERFTAERMAREYLEVYEALTGSLRESAAAGAGWR